MFCGSIMATKSTTSMTTTIQLALTPSHFTVQSSIKSGLYGHVSKSTAEVSESPFPAVSFFSAQYVESANCNPNQSKTKS